MTEEQQVPGPGPRRPRRRGPVVAAAGLLAVAGLGGLTYAVVDSDEPPPAVVASGSLHPAPTASSTPASTPAGSTPAPTGPASTGAAPAAGPAALPRSEPTRVRIPAIGVDTGDLTPIGVQRSGALEVPKGPAPIGWFTDAPPPGSLGPAVLAGHVSWNGTHGVFFRLGRLKAGDTVSVQRADRRTATFTVRAVRAYPKTEFPSADVYGNVDAPALRLITCAGDVDPATHRYADNVVVFADLTSVA